MRIAICDDEQFFRKELRKQLDNYAKEYAFDFVYTEFSSGQLLLESTIDFDLIFMDYQMNIINGIATVASLRKRNNKTTVIFVSSYPNIVFNSMKVQTYRFLVKPLKYTELCEALDSFISKYNSDAFVLVYDEDNDLMKRISENDIIYAEANNRYCRIMTADASYVYKGYLSDFEKMLKSDFFYRPHRTYIINFNYVDNYNTSNLFFENGERVPLSKALRTDFQKRYIAFLKRRKTEVGL